jgi:poly-gamma-glutamate capsule biosynthesis protein CapA/YwtB (metallophosphatase superfamily)
MLVELFCYFNLMCGLRAGWALGPRPPRQRILSEPAAASVYLRVYLTLHSDILKQSMQTTRRNVLLLPVLGLLPNRLGRSSAATAASVPDVRMLLGGDIMLSRFVGKLAHAKHDPAWPLHEVAELLASADISFANLESPFSDRNRGFERGMVFGAEPDMIAALKTAGIDVVSTANNHARDCGSRGIEFTLDLLARNGILAAGTAATAKLAHAGVIVARKGVGFGFLGYTFDQSNGNHKDVDDRIAMLDVDQMRADVAELRRRADVVMVSMHAGTEYQSTPNALQQRFARAAIDAGASVVVGHHPHVVQTIETYGDGVIYYSLGNLVFDQFQLTKTQRGWIADVHFVGSRLVSCGIIPIDIVNTVARVHAPAGAPASS